MRKACRSRSALWPDHVAITCMRDYRRRGGCMCSGCDPPRRLVRLDTRERGQRMPAQRRGLLSSGALPVPFGRSPAANSLPNFRRYEVIRAGSVVGSPCRIRSFASYVAASVGNGVDQPFVAQHTHCASRRGPGDLELFYQLTLGWYPRIRLVLARGDAPTKDVRDLPVRRNRSDRVNTVNAPICHIDNFSCMCLTSYVSSCVELASYVCRQADTGSYTLWSAGGVVRSLCSAQPFPAALSAADRGPRACAGPTATRREVFTDER